MATPMTKKVENSAKTYRKDDMIPCRSITVGKLFVQGAKTDTMYKWADYGDVEKIEYQDLIYMIRSKDPAVYMPRFIILEDDIISGNKDLANAYNKMYSRADLDEILRLHPDQMRKAIEELPDGAKEAIKGIVSTGIDNGTFDSISRVKIIDELFDTQLLMTLANS